MLTQKDIDIIEEILDEKLDEKLKFLPSKEEFYEKMDDVMGELKAIREEQTLMANRQAEHSDQLEDHESRIHRLEKSPSL